MIQISFDSFQNDLPEEVYYVTVNQSPSTNKE